MDNSEIMQQGNELLYDAATRCGAEFEFVGEDEVLVDEDDVLSYQTTLKVIPFATDEGPLAPGPCTFQIDYNRDDDEFNLIVGEDTEHEITYGNVMAYFYFWSLAARKGELINAGEKVLDFLRDIHSRYGEQPESSDVDALFQIIEGVE